MHPISVWLNIFGIIFLFFSLFWLGMSFESGVSIVLFFPIVAISFIFFTLSKIAQDLFEIRNSIDAIKEKDDTQNTIC